METFSGCLLDPLLGTAVDLVKQRADFPVPVIWIWHSIIHKGGVPEDAGEGCLGHCLGHQGVPAVLPPLPVHPPVAGSDVTCHVHDSMGYPDVVVGQLGLDVDLALPPSILLGHIRNVVHKLIRDKQFEKFIWDVTAIESENIKFAQNSGILDSHSYSDIIQLNVYAL